VPLDIQLWSGTRVAGRVVAINDEHADILGGDGRVERVLLADVFIVERPGRRAFWPRELTGVQR
jgi:hypothetical protein